MQVVWKLFGKLKQSLGDESRFWPLAAAIFGVVSFLKGLRKPCAWAVTQAYVNYDHGLIKRGFFGATVGKLLQFSHYLNFSIFSYLLLYILFRLLASLTKRSGLLTRIGHGEIAALFFSSVVISYMGVLVGYLDIPLAVLALVLVGIKDPIKRFIAAVPLCVVGVMVHEMFLVGFLPVILFSFALSVEGNPEPGRRNGVYKGVLGLAGVCGAVATFLALRGLVTLEMSKAMTAEAKKGVDFFVDTNVYAALTRNAKENFMDMYRGYTAFPEWRQQYVASLVIFLPLAALLVRFILQVLAGQGSKWLRVCALAAMFAPLSLGLLGSDCARWDALVCLDGFVILMLATIARPEVKIPIGPAMRNLIIVVIGLQMATGEFPMGMADHAPGANPYPFSQKASSLEYKIQSHSWQPPRP